MRQVYSLIFLRMDLSHLRRNGLSHTEKVLNMLLYLFTQFLIYLYLVEREKPGTMQFEGYVIFANHASEALIHRLPNRCLQRYSMDETS